jgi:hypothetical protein
LLKLRHLGRQYQALGSTSARCGPIVGKKPGKAKLQHFAGAFFPMPAVGAEHAGVGAASDSIKNADTGGGFRCLSKKPRPDISGRCLLYVGTYGLAGAVNPATL